MFRYWLRIGRIPCTRNILRHQFCSNAPSCSASSSPNWSQYTQRTHTCGELRLKNAGEKVTVFGWLAYRRMRRFLVLRDAYGLIQTRIPESMTEQWGNIPYESVLKVVGTVIDRGEGNRNAKMDTGQVEIYVEDLEILNTAPAQFPISIDSAKESNERTLLKYRYLQLRNESLQKALRLKSNLVHSIRRFLIERAGFVDVETPTLFRRTPGGANEFVVPAPKPNRGRFYSLPQSPQQFKQLLMVGGTDRYFQIARCYRDELSKLDRQPEFTQVDLELSFTSQEGVMNLVEDLIVQSWPQDLEKLKPAIPFERLTYSNAMKLYGSDKPDLRIPWKIQDCTEILRNSLNPSGSVDDKWMAKLFVAKNSAKSITKGHEKEFQRLIGMNPIPVKFDIYKNPTGRQWFNQIENSNLTKDFNIADDDAVVVCWGHFPSAVQSTLGQLRSLVADARGDIRNREELRFAWVVDFPLFVRNDDDGRLESAHHPFTAPIDEHQYLLESGKAEDFERITAQHYDLTLNGVELGGGSIRIHNSERQRHVLEKILGEDATEMEHLLSALSLGAPPHGGFALGLDRYVALLLGRGDPSVPIRNVIAFPKAKDGKCAMSGAPVKPTDSQLQRYGIVVVKEDDEE